MKRLAIALVALSACKDAPSSLIDGGVNLETFPIGGALGLSGLARTPDGVFWAVPERDRFMLRIPPHGLPEKIPITGAAKGLDLESLAWVGGATLAVGTESTEADRLTDVIYFGLISSTGIELKPRFVFDYGAFSTRAPRNVGVEALCAAEGRLIAGNEIALELRGRRVAPLMVFDLASGESKRYAVALTSKTGKLAGMCCRPTPEHDAIEALAIERHFGVSVIIRFIIPLIDKDQALPSEVVFDFGTRLNPPPNFEGIEWISDDEVILVSDNQYGGMTGETQVVHLPLPLHNHGK